MAERFEAGDVVQLKTGGPMMTVEGIDLSGRVICTWFQGPTRRQESITAAALKTAAEGWDRMDVPSVG